MIIHKKISGTVLFACTALFATAALALEIQLPPETAAYKPSELPGYQLVQRDCMMCHSANYVQMQPPSSRAYWETTVKKMKKPFGAQFPDEDVPAIVDYLSKTYGTEKTAAAPGMQKTASTAAAPGLALKH